MKYAMSGSFMSALVASCTLIAAGLFFFSFPLITAAQPTDGIVEEYCGQDNTSGKKILIAYDSKHGSTATVVRQIAGVLCDCGYQADISLARKVDDLSAYDAVVVGSPIYWAKFLPGIQRFLKKHEATLAAMPVAVFVLSTYADETTGLIKEEVKDFFVDKELEKVPSIKPVGEVGLFGGAFTLRTLFPVEVLAMTLENYSDLNYLNQDVVVSWSQNLCSLFQ